MLITGDILQRREDRNMEYWHSPCHTGPRHGDNRHNQPRTSPRARFLHTLTHHLGQCSSHHDPHLAAEALSRTSAQQQHYDGRSSMFTIMHSNNYRSFHRQPRLPPLEGWLVGRQCDIARLWSPLRPRVLQDDKLGPEPRVRWGMLLRLSRSPA